MSPRTRLALLESEHHHEEVEHIKAMEKRAMSKFSRARKASVDQLSATAGRDEYHTDLAEVDDLWEIFDGRLTELYRVAIIEVLAGRADFKGTGLMTMTDEPSLRTLATSTSRQ